MFNVKLPEHVQINLDPDPADGGKTFKLVITARSSPTSKVFKGQMQVARDPDGIKFAKDLAQALSMLYQATKEGSSDG